MKIFKEISSRFKMKISKEIKTERGVLKYRMPNIIEAYSFLGLIKVLEPGINSLTVKGNAIEHLHIFLDYSQLKGVSSYEDLLSDVTDMSESLGEIADEILAKALEVFKKKTS